MANNFKLKTKASVGVTTVGIYTVPALTTTTIIGITLANISGGSVNVTVGIARTVADNISLVKKDRKSTRLNSSHVSESRMPSSA